MAAKIAMIAITTSSSMSVNAPFLLRVFFIVLFVFCFGFGETVGAL
jgi:hypothetical protein